MEAPLRIDAEAFRELDDFFENAPISLHIVGPDGIIKRANKAELEFMGYANAPQDYIGRHIAEFHAESAVIADMLETLVSGKPLLHYRANLRRRDGAIVPVIIYSSPRIDNGDFINTRCFTYAAQLSEQQEPDQFSWPQN